MDFGVFVPIVAMTAVAVMTVSVAGVATKWLEYRKARHPRSLPEIEERLNRIEQAVDAIAIETERVSEGQRFVTKLLSERASGTDRQTHAKLAKPAGSA